MDCLTSFCRYFILFMFLKLCLCLGLKATLSFHLFRASAHCLRPTLYQLHQCCNVTVILSACECICEDKHMIVHPCVCAGICVYRPLCSFVQTWCWLDSCQGSSLPSGWPDLADHSLNPPRNHWASRGSQRKTVTFCPHVPITHLKKHGCTCLHALDANSHAVHKNCKDTHKDNVQGYDMHINKEISASHPSEHINLKDANSS